MSSSQRRSSVQLDEGSVKDRGSPAERVQSPAALCFSGASGGALETTFNKPGQALLIVKRLFMLYVETF